MDSSIPLGRRTIGLDPLIGLAPGLGDLAGALISTVIVARAVRAGIPKVAIARMLANIAIDATVGAVPVVGDAFDFVYKTNKKNLRIYEQWLSGDSRSELRHWGFFAALAAVLLGSLAAIAIAVLMLAQTFLEAVGLA